MAMLCGFEKARTILASNDAPTRALLEDLLAKTQAALALVRAEGARDPRRAHHAQLELVALIEALGQRLSALPVLDTASMDRVVRTPALLLS